MFGLGTYEILVMVTIFLHIHWRTSRSADTARSDNASKKRPQSRSLPGLWTNGITVGKNVSSVWSAAAIVKVFQRSVNERILHGDPAAVSHRLLTPFF